MNLGRKEDELKQFVIGIGDFLAAGFSAFEAMNIEGHKHHPMCTCEEEENLRPRWRCKHGGTEDGPDGVKILGR